MIVSMCDKSIDDIFSDKFSNNACSTVGNMLHLSIIPVLDDAKSRRSMSYETFISGDRFKLSMIWHLLPIDILLSQYCFPTLIAISFSKLLVTLCENSDEWSTGMSNLTSSTRDDSIELLSVDVKRGLPSIIRLSLNNG